ncbi:MAG: radical SAM protein [Anaerolineaceae bacterium]
MRRKLIFVNAADGTKHTRSANAAIYPNLGLLSLMSELKDHPECLDIEMGYFDGTVYGNQVLAEYIAKNHESIFGLCFSALTSNYRASTELASQAKILDDKIVTIFGNDHFSLCYDEAMSNQRCIDFGFRGNDVVQGFTKFISDLLANQVLDLASYSGLVYRDQSGLIGANLENEDEYRELALVDYSLADSFLPHLERYLKDQQTVYAFMKERGLRGMVVDIGRGCIKLGGHKIAGIPANSCDFCGILAGSKAIANKGVARAWTILENAYKQGFNYFYITADELPLTQWPLLEEMIKTTPDWYKEIPISDRPEMFGYTSAAAFAQYPKRIDLLVNALGMDHFFVGLDGLSEISLKLMNKATVGKTTEKLMDRNYIAMEMISKRSCLVTAGIVLTHLGITPAIMEENYQTIRNQVAKYPRAFAALDFGPLCPLPGSRAFQYLVNPELAEERAAPYGLNVNKSYLNKMRKKYVGQDIMDINELIQDFVIGCCPDISMNIVNEYIQRITDLAVSHGIVVGGGV